MSQTKNEAVTNAVNQGFLVRVPRSELAYEDWTGTGYLMERPSTGEAGYMLSGMIAGGMSVWGMTRWNQTLADILQYTYVEPPNKDPTSAYYIQKIGATDLQSATVKEKLPKTLQVIVKDKDRKPVPNASVTFIVKAGGGKLYDRNGQEVDSLSGVTTNAKGIAEAVFRVGHYTGKNPTFMKLDEKDTYVSQVGENIIDAALSSSTKVLIPFTAYGIPGEPDHMTKYYGDNINGHILQMIGFVSVMVEDQYYNPLSNKIVTFTAKDIAEPKCVAPGEQRLSAMLVYSGHACMLPLPSYDACKCSGSPCESGGKTLERKTIRGGAAAQVFLGAVPEATYEIEAVCGALRQTFHVHSNSYGNCGPNAEPFHVLKVHWMPWVGLGGALVHAYSPGQIATLTARMWVINEEAAEELGSATLDCDPPPPLTCNNKVIGSKKYSEITDLESARITFGGNPGKSIGGGLYEGQYTVKPGLNKVELKGNVTMKVRKTTMECPSTCRLDNAYPLELQDSRIMQFYGVEVKMDTLPGLMVDGSGYLMADTLIGFTVEPEDYPVGTAYAILYEDGREYSVLASVMIYGTGFVFLSQGFKIDPTKTYEVQVILNRGSHVEISVPKEKLKFGKIYIQDKTPGFEDSLLKPFDYYPALGAKTIVVRGELAGGVPMDSGKIRAELVYPYPSLAIYQKIHILQPEADMRAGRAEFTLRADPDVTPQDLAQIEIKFTYLVNDNDNGSVQGTWKVRNNSNVKFGEVLAGEAVFVFDDQAGINHEGKTPANVTEDQERYFDFVQELLNQVVPRKRSVIGYNLLDEQGTGRGVYNNTVAQVIGTFKEHFRVDNVGKPQGDFMKLLTDYNKTAEIETWRNQVIDKYILVGKNLNISHNIINPSTEEGDTGLYELYDNVVKKFVNSQIHLSDSYRKNVYPENDLHQWVSRIFSSGVTYTVTGLQQPMSYSFGGRQTVRQFNSTVSKHGAPKYSDVQNNASGVSVYQQYRGNIMDAGSNVTDPIQLKHGIVGGGIQKWPGLFEEDPWGNKEYDLGNSGSKKWCYHEYWAGIDCIGFVLHNLRYAERPGQYDWDQLVGENDTIISGIRVGDVCVSNDPGCSLKYNVHYSGTTNPMGWTNVPKFFNTNNDDLLYYWEKTDDNQKLIHKGDFVRYGNTHITNVYSERWGDSNFNANYDIIHAYGMQQADINNDGILTDYARKVVKSPNQIKLPSGAYSLSNSKGFGRIKLWD